MAKAQKRNLKLLYERLWKVSDGLDDGSMRPADAKERNNNAGKMIAAASLELEYRLAKKQYKDIRIDFFEEDGD